MSGSGRKQANSLALAFKESDFSAIYSSPLKRALDTAQAIANYHNLQVHVESDLRELEVGELEGVSLNNLNNDFSNFLIKWHQGQGAEKLPGGESLADLRNRAWSTAQRIASEHEGTVVLVSHYFTILNIICAALGLPLSYIRRLRIQVSSVSILDFGDRHPLLVSLGNTCHLRED